MMHPFIVVEGPDGVGKSTLAQELVRQSGGHYMHLTYRFKDRMFDYHWAAFELALKWLEKGPVVLDRWWPSEIVYAAAFRGGSKWPMGSRMLERAGMKHGVHYVLCLPQNKQQYLEFYESTKAATEDVAGQRSVLFDLYHAWYHRMGQRDDFQIYDMWHNEQGGRLQEYAQMTLEHVQDRLAGLPGFMTDRNDRRFAGNPRPEVLLVGKGNRSNNRRKLWPFFEHANSSLWLAKKLEQVGIREFDLGWLNMFAPDGQLQWTSDELLAFGGAKYVAMGYGAKIGLEMCGIDPDWNIPHPVYFRRFNPNESYTFENLATMFNLNAGDAYRVAARNLSLA